MKNFLKAAALGCAFSFVAVPGVPVTQNYALAAEQSMTDDERAESFYESGQMYFQQSYIEQALEDYNFAIRLKSDEHKFYAARAQAYYVLGNKISSRDIDWTASPEAQALFQKCVENYTSAIKYSNNSVVNYYQARGIAYTELDQWDKALADFGVVMKARPNDYTIYIRCAETYIDKGDYDKALQNLDKAKKLNPKNVIYDTYYRAVILKEKGNYKEALKNFDKLTAGGKFNFSLAWLQKGIIYEKLNQPYNAIEAYGEFLNRDNEHNKVVVDYVNSRLKILSNPKAK